MTENIRLVTCNEPQNCGTVKELEAKLKELQKGVIYFHDLLLDAYPCVHRCLGDYCEDFAPTACPGMQARVYFQRHPDLRQVITQAENSRRRPSIKP